MRNTLFVLACLALAACEAKPLSDKMVRRKEIGSKMECKQVIGGSGCINMEVPAYYLISNDNMTCEVETSKEYIMIRAEHLHLCAWEDVVP